MTNILNKIDIEEIEMDLTGVCNLSCPLCTRNYVHAKPMLVKNIRPLPEITNQLDTFINLKRFACAGTISEPTLYPDFIEFVKYLNSRSITYEIFSNGNTHDEKWWEELGKIINGKSRVIFTVCGSTQELHEKYRVGSNLQQILDNVVAFRKNNKHNDWCQHILFEYNKDDLKNMNTIFNMFSHHFQVQSEGRRRLNEKIKPCPVEVRPIKKIETVQNMLFDKIQPLNSSNVHIVCESFKNKKLYINQFGKISYCFTHAEFENDYFEAIDRIDYSKIEQYNYYDCFLCSTYSRMFMDKFNFSILC